MIWVHVFLSLFASLSNPSGVTNEQVIWMESIEMVLGECGKCHVTANMQVKSGRQNPLTEIEKASEGEVQLEQSV